MRKRILAIALAMTMIVGMNQTVVSATETQTAMEGTQTETITSSEAGGNLISPDESSGSLAAMGNNTKGYGYQAPQAVEIDMDSISADQIWNPDEALDSCGTDGTAVYWESFTSDYFVAENKLSAAELNIWNQLEDVCEVYLYSEDTAEDYGGSYGTEVIDFSALQMNKSEAIEFANIFVYAHPQYYYLSNLFLYVVGNNQKVDYMAIGVYDAYAAGTVRNAATTAFKNQIDEWTADIQTAGSTAIEQEREAHDLICDEVTYAEHTYDQSTASTVFYKQTVCAGYAKIFALLMNGLGIETIAVTSANHAWNEIKIDGVWYVVDATWDDTYMCSYGLIYYQYYNIDYATACAGDDNGYHVKESVIMQKANDCTNIMSEISRDEKKSAPVISSIGTTITIDYNKDDVIREGNIYYTIDGSVPTNDSTRYSGSFVVSKDTQVRAFVSDGYHVDSRVVKGGPINYTISFNGNGATSGSTANMSCTYGSGYNLSANGYSRTGYTFTGWNTAANGTGTAYANQAAVNSLSATNGANVTLYAQWTVNKYTIKFAKNGATSGKMSNLTNRSYGSTYKLTANKYKRTGYTFTGWNTKANGKGKTYKNKASVKSLTSANGKTVTLYAQWKKTKYTISYKLNKGKNNKKNKKYYYVTTSTIKLKNPTRKGYTFKGWYTSSKYKKKVTRIKKGSTGKVVLYAKWVKKS